jgi:hypothetical protein
MSRLRSPSVSIALIAFALGLAGCMPGPNPLKGTPVGDGHAAGFLLGFWHGLIGPVTFVMSLLKDGTGFYEVHNNGGWYNAGFLVGLGIILGGGSFQGKVQMRRGNPRPSSDAGGSGSSAPEPPPPGGGSARGQGTKEPADDGPAPGSRSNPSN